MESALTTNSNANRCTHTSVYGASGLSSSVHILIQILAPIETVKCLSSLSSHRKRRKQIRVEFISVLCYAFALDFRISRATGWRHLLWRPAFAARSADPEAVAESALCRVRRRVAFDRSSATIFVAISALPTCSLKFAPFHFLSTRETFARTLFQSDVRSTFPVFRPRVARVANRFSDFRRKRQSASGTPSAVSHPRREPFITISIDRRSAPKIRKSEVFLSVSFCFQAK